MNIVSNIVVNLYSIAVLTIIYIQNVKNEGKEVLQYKIYMAMLKIAIFMLIMDVFSRFDGRPGTIYPYINHISNFLMFAMNLFIASLWIMYVHDQVIQDEKNTRRLAISLILLNVINIITVIVSQFFGWFYYIDDANIYHRGHLFWVSVLLVIGLIIFAIILVIKNKSRIEKKYYYSLIWFAIPPFAGIILQTFFYGISIMLNCFTLSMLIVFVNVQNHSMYTDYLTGIYNRKKLDLYLREKINTSLENKTFSAIMLDLNDFKSINDLYGHDIGDKALKICVKLLNSCLEEGDFIARFGGDEFCIILNTYNESMLEDIVSRIKECFHRYNKSGKHPYNLEVSIGYAIYDTSMKMEDFQKMLDIFMYQNKNMDKLPTIKD